ncbi:GAP family protein [Kitasatospora sp. NPDC088351]|uniref:GAP family protein n=1 Tax=unclassified Kitasatospora TaxID=2633591 RepID=UPI00341CB5A5
MGDAVGQMLASAVGIAISPLPLIAVILMLATPKGRVNGAAFAAGWAVALAAVVTVVVLAGSGLTTGSSKPVWAWWLKLAIGVFLLLLGLTRWKDRPREGHVHGPPTWMRTVHRSTPGRVVGLAAVLLTADPKNLVLAVGGALSIATSTASGSGKAVAAALLVLVGSLCTLLPSAVHLFGGDGAARTLGEWKAWTAAHNPAIVLVSLVVLGATYVGDAISRLTI